jgi:hypothetical protein
MGYKPVNKYLPPRRRPAPAEAAPPAESGGSNLLRWLDRVLSR